MKKLGFFKHAMSDKNIEPCEGGVIIAMEGFNRFESFYLCIPVEGFHTRTGNSKRYGDFSYEYFFNGEFLGGGRMDKKDKIEKLCNAGYVSEAIEYLKGHRMWRETELGGKHIIEAKERARISHFYCDTGGKEGHDERQMIRRMLRNNN